MGPGEIYHVSRSRLLDLAPELSSEQLAAPLPPTPPWVVLDAYRHLAGVCADVLAGNLPAPGADEEWTAAQLADRSGWTIDEVCAEWTEQGPELDQRVAESGGAMAFIALDSWTHEQDVRAATGVGALHDDELLEGVLRLALKPFGRRYAGSGAPALRLVLDDGAVHDVGAGEPEVELHTSGYEALRTIFGRRSAAQVAALDWRGERAAEAQEAAHVFPFPATDIED